jgi:hypothetical protein
MTDNTSIIVKYGLDERELKDTNVVKILKGDIDPFKNRPRYFHYIYLYYGMQYTTIKGAIKSTKDEPIDDEDEEIENLCLYHDKMNEYRVKSIFYTKSLERELYKIKHNIKAIPVHTSPKFLTVQEFAESNDVILNNVDYIDDNVLAILNGNIVDYLDQSDYFIHIGIYYLYVKKDRRMGKKYLDMALSEGHKDAYVSLGKYYLQDKYEKNIDLALNCFTEAIKCENSNGHIGLYGYYGKINDLEKYEKHLLIAADQQTPHRVVFVDYAFYLSTIKNQRELGMEFFKIGLRNGDPISIPWLINEMGSTIDEVAECISDYTSKHQMIYTNKDTYEIGRVKDDVIQDIIKQVNSPAFIVVDESGNVL